jgi:hypothetical protein
MLENEVMRAPLSSGRRGIERSRRYFDGLLHAVIGHAAAERAVHRLANLRVGRVRVAIEQRLGSDDLAVLAEAALRHLLVDPRLLDRMQPSVRRQPFERGDLGPHRGHRRHAGAHGGAVDDHRARAALPEPASEARPLQAEIVAQDVQQRRRGFDVDRMRFAVDLQRDPAHENSGDS